MSLPHGGGAAQRFPGKNSGSMGLLAQGGNRWMQDTKIPSDPDVAPKVLKETVRVHRFGKLEELS
jgi:hypothetical protein